MDRWVVWAANTFKWPPSVTREQTMRDLVLLSRAST